MRKIIFSGIIFISVGILSVMTYVQHVSNDVDDLLMANVAALTSAEEDTGEDVEPPRPLECATRSDTSFVMLDCEGTMKPITMIINNSCQSGNRGSCLSGSIYTFMDCEGSIGSTNDYTTVIVCN